MAYPLRGLKNSSFQGSEKIILLNPCPSLLKNIVKKTSFGGSRHILKNIILRIPRKLFLNNQRIEVLAKICS